MKRGSFIVVSSLTLASGLVAAGPAQAVGSPGRLRAHSTVARKLQPRKTRLARRLHAALRHELGAARPLRRPPHRHAGRTATYSLDELSRSENVVTSAPTEPAYTRVDASGGSVDLWTDPQGHVRYTITRG
jgi:hypothetical protein